MKSLIYREALAEFKRLGSSYRTHVFRLWKGHDQRHLQQAANNVRLMVLSVLLLGGGLPVGTLQAGPSSCNNALIESSSAGANRYKVGAYGFGTVAWMDSSKFFLSRKYIETWTGTESCARTLTYTWDPELQAQVDWLGEGVGIDDLLEEGDISCAGTISNPTTNFYATTAPYEHYWMESDGGATAELRIINSSEYTTPMLVDKVRADAIGVDPV